MSNDESIEISMQYNASVRFVHAFQGQTEVSLDVYVGEKVLQEKLAFGEISQYFEIESGVVTIRMRDSDSKRTIAKVRTKFQANKLHTFLVEGDNQEHPIQATLVRDHMGAADHGSALFRFVHAAAGVDGVDVYVNNVLVFENVQYLHTGTPNYFKLDLGIKDIVIKRAGTEEDVALPAILSMVSGSVHTFTLMKGPIGSMLPSFLATCDDTPRGSEVMVKNFSMEKMAGKWYRIAAKISADTAFHSGVEYVLDNESVNIISTKYDGDWNPIAEDASVASAVDADFPAALILTPGTTGGLVKEVSIKDASKKEVPVKDVSAKDVSFKEVSVKDVSVKDVSVKDSPIKDVSVKDVSVKDAPVKDVSVKNSPIKDVSVKDSPIKDVSVKDSPIKDVSVKDSPIKDVSVKDAPIKDVSVKDVPVKDTSIKDSPIKDVSVKDVPAKDISVKDVSVKDATAKGNSDVKEIVVNDLFVNGVPVRAYNEASVKAPSVSDTPIKDSSVIAASRKDCGSATVEPDIIVHKTDYVHYAIVGSPDRNNLVVLSRAKKMKEHSFLKIRKYLECIGYDVSDLKVDDDTIIRK